MKAVVWDRYGPPEIVRVSTPRVRQHDDGDMARARRSTARGRSAKDHDGPHDYQYVIDLDPEVEYQDRGEYLVAATAARLSAAFTLSYPARGIPRVTLRVTTAAEVGVRFRSRPSQRRWLRLVATTER